MKELSEVLQDWEAVIGLEIHTELAALDTKMFCNCKLSHDDEPNANVCPVCLGLPGALPVPNKRAIESIVKAGLATNCEIQRHSMFYRKHYFYPDMAKNFQTTQGPVAFCMRGHLDLDVDGPAAKERGDIFVSPDIATCDKCRAELFDPKDRRYLHPFINCTACGPRLTILESMPYDRERTSMKEFPMCEACHEEYVLPESRRYDVSGVCGGIQQSRVETIRCPAGVLQ